MSDDRVVVTSAARGEEVRLVIYGLSLRGIDANIRESRTRNGDAWDIVVDARHAEAAKEILPSIWDAVLELPRAITPGGECPFCGYDVLGVPSGHPCPECGVDLDSVEARRAYRDGRKPRA